MAEGEGTTPNGSEGEGTPQDPSKVFSKGYNEGLEKGESRFLRRFSELTGQDFSAPDDAFNWAKTASSKLAESVSDPTATEEYKTLQSQLKEQQSKYEQAVQQAQQIQNQYKFDSTWNGVAGELSSNGEFKIPKDDVKALFKTRYSVEFKDGKEIVKRGDVPVMNESGEYRPLNDVMKEFSKSYIQTTVEGTGGGSGSGGGGKVKRSEFNKAIQTNDHDKAADLFARGEEHGWIEE